MFSLGGDFLREFGYKVNGFVRLDELFLVLFNRFGEIVVVYFGIILLFIESC